MDQPPCTRAPLFRSASFDHGALRRVPLRARAPRWSVVGVAYALVAAATMACGAAVLRTDHAADAAARPPAAVACARAAAP